MTENLTRTARIRKPEYGGDCAICNSPVELLTDKEPWLVKCRCSSVEIPNYVKIDSYAKRQYLRRFEIVTVPKETEG
jgi:hypothetical protein